MSKKVKVLHFIYDLSIGGAQAVVMNYLRLMKDDTEFDLTVAVCETSKKSEFDNEVKENKYPVDYLGYKKVNAPPVIRTIANWFKYQWLIYKEIRRVKPDIIHSHLTHLLPYILFPAVVSGVKIRLHTMHSDPEAIEKRYVPWARCAFGLFGVMPVAVTESQAKKAKSIYGFKNCSVIGNGIDINRFNISETKADIRQSFGIAEDCFVIGFVGRLHIVKNIGFLLEVFNEYKKNNPNAVLVIAGDGGEREKIRHMADAMGVSDSVKFLGMRKDIERIYKMIDVFMLTSFYESSSIATVEAQISGARCVISDRIPKDVIISDKVNRLSLDAPRGDWIQAIDGKIKNDTIVNEPEFFGNKKTVNDLKDLYRSLLKKDKKKQR